MSQNFPSCQTPPPHFDPRPVAVAVRILGPVVAGTLVAVGTPADVGPLADVGTLVVGGIVVVGNPVVETEDAEPHTLDLTDDDCLNSARTELDLFAVEYCDVADVNHGTVHQNDFQRLGFLDLV